MNAESSLNPGFAILCALLYAAVTALQYRQLRSPDEHRRLLWLSATAALILHGITLAANLTPLHSIDLGLYSAASLITATITVTGLIGAVFSPAMNVLLFAAPIAMISVLADQFLEDGYMRRSFTLGILTHIVASIVAYAVLSMAACQSLLLAYQEHQLRHSRSLQLLRALPPLAVMEEFLFQLIWIGLALLSAAIVSGLLFLDNMFAQRVVHHAVLSMTSWCVFAVLLWGRFAAGWRGPTAIRWTLSGFALLVLAYFGSKFVIELVLNA